MKPEQMEVGKHYSVEWGFSDSGGEFRGKLISRTPDDVPSRFSDLLVFSDRTGKRRMIRLDWISKVRRHDPKEADVDAATG